MTYLDYVRSLPCGLCEAPAPSQAHHAIDVGIYPGMGRKACDALSMPLCAGCHRSVHEGKARAIDQLAMVARTLDRAASDGWTMRVDTTP
jgi:hypothetical protein